MGGHFKCQDFSTGSCSRRDYTRIQDAHRYNLQCSKLARSSCKPFVKIFKSVKFAQVLIQVLYHLITGTTLAGKLQAATQHVAIRPTAQLLGLVVVSIPEYSLSSNQQHTNCTPYVQRPAKQPIRSPETLTLWINTQFTTTAIWEFVRLSNSFVATAIWRLVRVYESKYSIATVGWVVRRCRRSLRPKWWGIIRNSVEPASQWRFIWLDC